MRKIYIMLLKKIHLLINNKINFILDIKKDILDIKKGIDNMSEILCFLLKENTKLKQDLDALQNLLQEKEDIINKLDLKIEEKNKLLIKDISLLVNAIKDLYLGYQSLVYSLNANDNIYNEFNDDDDDEDKEYH